MESPQSIGEENRNAAITKLNEPSNNFYSSLMRGSQFKSNVSIPIGGNNRKSVSDVPLHSEVTEQGYKELIQSLDDIIRKRDRLEIDRDPEQSKRRTKLVKEIVSTRMDVDEVCFYAEIPRHRNRRGPDKLGDV